MVFMVEKPAYFTGTYVVLRFGFRMKTMTYTLFIIVREISCLPQFGLQWPGLSQTSAPLMKIEFGNDLFLTLGARVWTEDYSNILGVLKFLTKYRSSRRDHFRFHKN